MSRPNVFSREFPLERPETGVKGTLLAPDVGARELGASVYELAPGAPASTCTPTAATRRCSWS